MTANFWRKGSLLAIPLLLFLWWAWSDSETDPVQTRPEPAPGPSASENRSQTRRERLQHRRPVHDEECAACPDVPPSEDAKRTAPLDLATECLDLIMDAAASGVVHPDTSHLGDCRTTPLHVVSNLEDLQTLLDNGANPNVRDHVGRTPLHLVAFTHWGTLEMIIALLEAGADPTIKDDRGRTPEMMLMMRPNMERTRYISKRLALELAAAEQQIPLEEYLSRRPHIKLEYVQPDDSDIIEMILALRRASYGVEH